MPGLGRLVLLNGIGDDEWFAVLSLEQCVGIFGIDKLLGFLVDHQQLVADAITDVGKVTQGRTAVPVFDVRVGKSVLADRLHEVFFVF